ncbi:MAG: sulfite exporter TauE/SafE family protein [Eubacterium sp.]|nr:sulfite exporter TauE/SafE family protein [Eubacterium sp.]
MKDVIYIIVSLFSTLIGSISGMGGGVIMKPIFDMLGDYSAFQISVLTSSTVFAMSAVSVGMSTKKFKQEKEKSKTIFCVASGSLVGGLIGDFIFNFLVKSLNDNSVKAVQNAVLLILVIAVIIYMNSKNRKSLERNNNLVGIPVGLMLGIISAFLGIGGGPINVAVLIFVFGFEIKTAVICSLSSVLFCQFMKLISIVFNHGAQAFNMKILIFVVIAGVIGALCGRIINRKLSDKAVNGVYTAVQVIVIAMCFVNIYRSIFA